MTTAEFEIRLYQPSATRPLYFTRAASAQSAQALARRWQAARPECIVRVFATTAPRPRSVLDLALVTN